MDGRGSRPTAVPALVPASLVREDRGTLVAMPAMEPPRPASGERGTRRRIPGRRAWLGIAIVASTLTPVVAADEGVTRFGLAQAERAKVFTALPNWSGLWNPVGGLIFDPGTADPKGNNAQQPGDREHPPYNPEWEAKYQAKLDHTLAGYFTDPITNCLPHGMPRLMGGIPGPLEFVVTPEQTWIIWEYGPQLRRIYTDGRGHLAPDERFLDRPLGRRHAGGRYRQHARRHPL